MNKKIDALFTKKSDDWATPTEIYNIFMDRGFLDPCPFKSSCNGFGIKYYNSRIYINPPFSQNKLWIKYAVDLALDNNDVWLLIACRTDTNYFRYIFDNIPSLIYFIQGRVSFNDKGHAPFPVCFIHINKLCMENRYLVGTQDEFIDYIASMY